MMSQTETETRHRHYMQQRDDRDNDEVRDDEYDRLYEEEWDGRRCLDRHEPMLWDVLKAAGVTL